ncbi:LOW QUALITY PROTEIN: hypothetical protein RJ640_000099 [Escallonia rubra]|uniref:Uncharacterized protein n=1 Tax=Escallonia rubra TaxID=112253 RepID=A0AA88QW08_9ASTE|nr:LOW QUALITY PROTEIN: hypothetical protein RJ640_000099 [Escallonia rubra]
MLLWRQTWNKVRHSIYDPAIDYCLEWNMMLYDFSFEAEAARELLKPLKRKEISTAIYLSRGIGAVAISETVKRSDLLEDFQCYSARVESVGGSALSEAPGMCPHLRKIDVQGSGIQAGLTLSKSISKNLRELNISSLDLEDDGVISIANGSKQTAPYLESLEMAGNGMRIS